MPSELLTTEMQKEHKKWARSAILYGTISTSIRVLLILTSTIVAAQNNLNGSPMEFLITWVPVFALTVSILTAIDAWLKPRDKWRGFLEDRDDLGDLVIKAETDNTPSSGNTSVAYLESLRKEFTELRRRHRDKNVY